MDGMGKLLMACALVAAVGSVDAATVERANQDDPAIRFAASELTRILRDVDGKVVLAEDATMSPQAWRFKTTEDGTLVISGRDGMGVSYGVSTFLEKYAGVAWLAPDTDVVPDLKSFALPKLDEEGAPAYFYREMYCGSDIIDGTWRLRNKESRRARHGVGAQPGSPRDNHTFGDYCAALRKAHPELFGPHRLNAEGKVCQMLCMTDEKTRDFVAEEMCRHIAADRAAASGKPGYLVPAFYDLSQCDGASAGECMCDGCRALREREGSYAGPNIAFVNAVADRVKRKYPDVLIQTFAYAYTENPPKTVKAADNVIVRFCRSHIYHQLLPGSPNGAVLEAWSRHASKIGVWGYWRNTRGTVYPFVQPVKTMEAELRYCHDRGVIAYFAEDEEPRMRAFAMLQHWLFLKLTDDPRQNANELAKKFFRGYYGKAARPMAEYLNYLEGREEESRQFLDREFFEKVNAWLDRAEELAQGDELALRHIRWERIVVDRTTYDRLGTLLRAGYAFDRDRVARRFAANVRDQIVHWPGFDGPKAKDVRERRLREAEDEGRLYAHYPIEIPKRFAGLEVEDRHWNRCCGGRSVTVADPDACAGTAFYNNRDDVHKLPYSMGFYSNPMKCGDSLVFSNRKDVPQDEKFHLYRIGRTVVESGLYMTYDPTWENRHYVGVIGIVPEPYEVWVSMKFQGPNFVSGSTKENRVLFDRLLFVKNDDPMRGYRVDGAPVAANVALQVEGGEKYAFRQIRLGPVENFLKCDLLIRGRTRYSGIDRAKGDSPVTGLWALNAKGENAFIIPCAQYFLGDSEWYPFERVIEAVRIRRYANEHPEPLTLYFRTGLKCPGGSVAVKDVEIVPIKNEMTED